MPRAKKPQAREEEVIARIHGLALENGYEIRIRYKTYTEADGTVGINANLALEKLSDEELKNIKQKIKEIEKQAEEWAAEYIVNQENPQVSG